MSKNHAIRKEIRKIVEEIYDLSHTAIPFVGRNSFPYSKDDILGDEGIKDYFQIFNSFTKNQDIFDWPENDFKKGMDVEKQKDPSLGTLELAGIVVNNLKADRKYYDNSIYV